MRWLFLLLLVAFAGWCAANAAPEGAENPFTRHALTAREHYTFAGVVEQRFTAGSYVYLRVRDDAGRSDWVATLAATTPDSRRVSVLVMARAESFHSRLLNREFAPLLFAAVRTAPDR